MDNIENKSDISPPPEGVYDAKNFNTIYIAFCKYLQKQGVILNANDSSQLANAIARGENPIKYYTDATINNDILYLKASNGITIKNKYKNGDIIYLQPKSYYPNFSKIQIDNLMPTDIDTTMLINSNSNLLCVL